MRIVLLSIMFFIIISCSPKNYENVPFTNDEFKIYSIVIDSLYYQKETDVTSNQKAPTYIAHNYVLIDSTNAETANSISDRLNANGISSKDLVNIFQNVNTKRYSLVEYSNIVSNIKLISLDKYKGYYKKYRNLNDGGMTGFIEFSKEFPHSFGTSVFQVTRVGFSSDNKYAIVGSMHLRGINMGYDYCYLEKYGEKWIIKKIINH